MSAATLLLATALMSNRSALINSFSPASLFTSGEKGYFFDPSDFSTLFQDNVAATPVTGVGQPVRTMIDKSQNRALGPELLTNGSFANGGSSWALLGTGNTTTFNGGAAQIQGTTAPGIRQNGVLTIGKVYQVSFRVRRLAGTGTPFFVPNLSLPVIGTEWQTITAVRVAGNANLDVGLSGTATGSVLEVTDISLKEVLGNHAIQNNSASSPILGRHPASGQRNLITYTEDLTNAAWMKGVAAPGVVPIVTPNFAVAPDGTNTATRLQLDGGAAGGVGNSQVANQHPIWQATVVSSVWMRSLAGNVLVTLLVGGNTTNVTVTDTWQKIVVVRNNATQGNNEFRIAKRDVWGTPGSADLLVWHPQVEHGAIPTDYQKVTGAWDVTEPGQPDVYYIATDGVDDFIAGAAIDPGSDKAQVFMGLRKLSDATESIPFEFGGGSGFDGTISLAVGGGVGNTEEYTLRSRGQTNNRYAFTTDPAYNAPHTAVITGLCDISAGTMTLRVNGAVAGVNSQSQGSTNYLPSYLYIGRRAGSSSAFGGRMYPFVLRFGPNLTAAQIAQTEAWVNSKTRAY